MFKSPNNVLAALLTLMVIKSCGRQGQPTQPPLQDGEVNKGEAPIESVEVVFLESFPLQVQLHVEGYMPDGCTAIESTEVEQQGAHFEVAIATTRPVAMACTEAIEPFEMNVPLDVYGLPAGEYSVDVNGVETSFTFEQENILQAE